MDKRKKGRTTSKIFVLDTSVILFDHLAIKNFQEHDIVIPITVLEELDQFKKGNDTVNFEARQFIRFIDGISLGQNLNNWVKISDDKKSLLKVFMEVHVSQSIDATKIFGDKKNDHLILNATLSTRNSFPDRQVILVSKDVNLRIKARSLGLLSEDYETGKVKDVEGLYKGITQMEWDKSDIIEKFHSHQKINYTEVLNAEPECNHFFIFKNQKNSALAVYNKQTGD